MGPLTDSQGVDRSLIGELETTLNGIETENKQLLSVVEELMQQVKKNDEKLQQNESGLRGMPEKREEKSTYDGTECVICMDSKRVVAFDPCGHFVSCLSCSEIEKCPICRGVIESVRPIFLS